MPGMPAAPKAPQAPVAPKAPTAPSTEQIGVNQTLYVSNLNDKIKPDVMAAKLKEVFQAFGGIIDIIAMKSLRRRGQAWIVFEKASASTKALESLQGFPLYNKPMRIAYARTVSDDVAKKNGTYVERPKIKKGVKKQRGTAPPAPVAPTAPTAPTAPSQMGGAQIPNKTLFVENLPEGVTEMMLKLLFQSYPAFSEVRIIPGRQVAFVDFQQEMSAAMAMQALQNFNITPTNPLRISFARK